MVYGLGTTRNQPIIGLRHFEQGVARLSRIPLNHQICKKKMAKIDEN